MKESERDTIRKGYILINKLEDIAEKYGTGDRIGFYNRMMFFLCSLKLIVVNIGLIIKINRLDI